jgi:long-chain fatty acid transport protein
MTMAERKVDNFIKAFCLIGAAILIAPVICLAGGFALLEQSAEGSGVAYAGATAGYGDGSAIFFNPGAMSRLDKTTISAGVSMIDPDANFKNQGSHINPALGGSPLSGDNGQDGGVTAWVPNFYAAQPTEIGLTFGLGWNVPFGLETKYSHTWVGRYSAVNTDLATMSISPAVSYAVTKDFSLGVAVNVMYARAELSNAIDFGTIGIGALGPITAAKLGLLPQMADGYGKVTGDDWGVGATAGASYSYAPGSQVGIAYRAPVKFTLRGDADFTVPANAAVLTSSGLFTDTDAKADLTLPDSISAGVIHKFCDDWALLGDVQWTHWTHFDELRVQYSSAQPDSVVNEDWTNAWRYSVGAQYWPIQPLRLSAGFTYDQEPIADRYHRTPRIPGNDRYWMAFGAAYYFTEWLKLDVGYAHLFVPEAKTEITGATGEVLQGSWDLGIDIVSAQLAATF